MRALESISDRVQRARDTVAQAPETTAAQHRDWIESHVDRLADEGQE
ncbi:MAG: hypothetical protein V5A55_14665 [Halovenus sp.]